MGDYRGVVEQGYLGTVSAPPAGNDSAYGDVFVLIPALNEEQSIALVLDQLPTVGRVIVIDNGSTDRTAERAQEAGAQVVAEPRRGYGSACLAGIAEVDRLIAEGNSPPRVVAFVDADNSDSPELLPKLVEPILAGEQDMVLGSRMLGKREPGAMPPQAVFGNHLASGLMRLGWGAPYTDLGPFRAIGYEALCRLQMSDTNYGWTIEMQLKAWRLGMRVVETPVPYRQRIGQSKISGTVRGSFAAGTKILYCLAKYGWSRLPQGKEL